MPKQESKKNNRQPIEAVIINRSLIKPYPKNPRTLDRSSEKRLWRHLDKYGLLSPLLVQRSTGFVLSGNQRLRWLDDRKKEDDYELQIVYCDVDDEQAKSIVVHMNNASAQGQWDMSTLESILDELSTDQALLMDASFSQLDLEFMFPSNKNLSAIMAAAPEAVEKIIDEVTQAKTLSRESRNVANKKVNEKRNDEPYLVIVFDSTDEKKQFLFNIGLPHNERFIDAALLKQSL